MARPTFTVTFVALAVATASAAYAGNACTPRSVSVSGSGRASAEPATYVFHLAVSQRGTDVRAANSAVDRTVGAALGVARQAGLRPSDIQSNRVAISPVYDPNAKPDTPQSYEVTRYLTLTLREPSRYASLVEGLIHAGVNRFAGVEAEAGDPRALGDQALAAAVADARHKAALIAGRLGVKLGPALALDESGTQPRPVVMGAAVMRSAQGGYEPGLISVNAEVTARFALEPSGCPGT